MSIGCGGFALIALFVFAFLNDAAGVLGADSGLLTLLIVAGFCVVVWAFVQFLRG